MWLITPIGFFSIVQKPGDKANGTLTVRSRVRSDLAALKQHYLPSLGPIQESHDTDYRFRAVAPRAEVSAAMARLVDNLDYSNFKSEVGKKQGHKRAGLYHKVWDVLYHLQTDPEFAEKDPVAESYGGVVVSGGRKVLLREPTKHHGGYAWTFAKTESKPGESPRDAAVRAVREKTGYDAEIRISVPGAFKGSASSTCYYVMDAKHPPAKPNWQTAGLRWVNFDEARELIRQSPNAEGRDRDMAILDAAEKVASAISYKEHPNVQPEDWQELKAMPERQTVLYPKLWFNPDEMAKIRRGFFPTVMEEKWFLYFTGDRLRMHRSWTGILIFDVGFAFDPKDGAYVTDVIVNRESREYSNTDDDEDLKMLEEIIRYHLLQPLEEPEVDGFVKAMSLAMQPKYLGSPEVVTALVKEVFDVAIRAIAEEATEDDFVEAVAKVISAFTDDDASYTRMPGWHSAEQLGAYVKKYLIGSDQGECLAEILGHGMTALIAKLQEMLGGFLKDPAANWEEHALVQLNALHQFVVTVLLGTNTVVSGEKTLSDFHWVAIGADAGGKQVIVEVGSEGGSLTLYGIQSAEGWQFRAETNEAALIDDEDMPDHPERPWVETWRSALKQLDGYPWTQLYPLAVHPEFRDKVFKALQTRKKKGLVIDWDQWGHVLNILVDEE
jgi:ADP-ribose pyrophosphatase YjhB (NUDIX family)